ncbi:MAG: hypothetical protein IMY69_00460 [Bacteroidetes bacterium]|nr:hypothetical protein [Bacteroidota bacterium]
MEKSVKIGWILMLILGLYRIMASISLVTMQQADITAGVNLATTGIAIIFITLASYKKAQKWSWWCLLVIGIAPLLSCSILHGIDVWTAIGWIIFILAIVIPAKAILCKKSA